MDDRPPRRFDLELDERKLSELLTRFQIPVEEAQRILDDAALVWLSKGDRIRYSERWMLYTIKLRCVAWWRQRRDRFYEVVDRGVRSTLMSPEIDSEVRAGFREDLYRLTDSLTPRCRSLLRRRYGLGPGTTVVGTEDAEAEASGTAPSATAAPSADGSGDDIPPEVLHCVAALVRRLKVVVG